MSGATGFPLPCDHRDAFGSTVIFVQDRPQDGVCLLCDAKFPMLRLVRPDPDMLDVTAPSPDETAFLARWYAQPGPRWRRSGVGTALLWAGLVVGVGLLLAAGLWRWGR